MFFHQKSSFCGLPLPFGRGNGGRHLNTNIVCGFPPPSLGGGGEGGGEDRQSLIYENKKHYIIATPIRSLHRL